MSVPSSRRGFLRGLTTLPLIGGGAALAMPGKRYPRLGQGCIMLDRPVFFDASVVPAIGDPAVVVLHDGRVAVLAAAQNHSDNKPGHVWVESLDPPPYGASQCLDHVGLVGAVIGEGALCA